jgi:hypothetical protein
MNTIRHKQRGLVYKTKRSEQRSETIKTQINELFVKKDLGKITEGDKLTLNSEITNLDNNIPKVDFYCGLKLEGSCEEKPYQAVIEQIPASGNYLWASVTDKEGNVSPKRYFPFLHGRNISVVGYFLSHVPPCSLNWI